MEGETPSPHILNGKCLKFFPFVFLILISWLVINLDSRKLENTNVTRQQTYMKCEMGFFHTLQHPTR